MWNLILPLILSTFPIQRELAASGPGLQEPAPAPLTAADAHLQGLARAIEKEVAEIRGMPFKHPVEVHYATKETFVVYMRAMEERMGGAQRAERDRQLMVLLQLIPSDLDMGALQEELLAGQVGGFYDPGEDTFFVMEGLSDDLIRIIMAHELTHALDDQYYDLAATDLALLGSSDAMLAHHAVIEGSAQVVMQRWMMKNMGTLDRQALLDAQEQMDLKALGGAPRILWKPLLATYMQGQAFLGRKAKLSIFASAQIPDLDLAFGRLPLSTEQILHPAKYWSEETRDEPHMVVQEWSKLPEGWQDFHSDILGELFLGLLTMPNDGPLNLASMLGLKYTDDSTSGWGGDRVQVLSKGESKVMVLDSVWDSEAHAAEFALALSGREILSDPLPGRSESLVLFQEGTRWVRLVSWSASSREEAKEVASRIQASASRSGKISASRPKAQGGTFK